MTADPAQSDERTDDELMIDCVEDGNVLMTAMRFRKLADLIELATSRQCHICTDDIHDSASITLTANAQAIWIAHSGCWDSDA